MRREHANTRLGGDARDGGLEMTLGDLLQRLNDGAGDLDRRDDLLLAAIHDLKADATV